MMNTSDSVFWIVFGLFLIVVIFFFKGIQAKKRTLALTNFAPTIGFIYEGEDWSDPARAARLKMALFERGYGKEFRNIMTGSFAGFDTSLFDYEYSTGGGKGGHTWVQTVVTFSQDLVLPLFDLRPETLLDRIGDTFTHKDIDFDSHPEFSRRFLLRGAEEESVRGLFTPALLTLLERLPDQEWQIEGGGCTLILYRSDITVDPEVIQPLLEETSSIAKQFLNCCGLKRLK